MKALSVAQARNILFGEADRKMGRLVVVAAAEHFAAAVQPCQGLAVGQWDIEAQNSRLALELAVDQFEQGIATLSRHRRERNA